MWASAGGVHEFAGDHGTRRDDAQQEDARGGGGEVGRIDAYKGLLLALKHAATTGIARPGHSAAPV